jgi:hypothetical protein
MSTLWQNAPSWLVLIAFVVLFWRIPVHAHNQDEVAVRVDVNLVILDATVKTKASEDEGWSDHGRSDKRRL